MACTGLRLSVVCIFVGLEEVHCFFCVYDDFAALLHAGGGEEGVFVALGCEVGAAEEGLDAFEAVDVASAGVLGRFGCGGAGVDAEFPKEFFEITNSEGGDGCCVFDNHGFDDWG